MQSVWFKKAMSKTKQAFSTGRLSTTTGRANVSLHHLVGDNYLPVIMRGRTTETTIRKSMNHQHENHVIAKNCLRCFLHTVRRWEEGWANDGENTFRIAIPHSPECGPLIVYFILHNKYICHTESMDCDICLPQHHVYHVYRYS